MDRETSSEPMVHATEHGQAVMQQQQQHRALIETLINVFKQENCVSMAQYEIVSIKTSSEPRVHASELGQAVKQ